jgi:hypothetical protein
MKYTYSKEEFDVDEFEVDSASNITVVRKDTTTNQLEIKLEMQNTSTN